MSSTSKSSTTSSAEDVTSVRQIMLGQYTPWVMNTYGDSAKTKTITARKYARIVAHLIASTTNASTTMDKEQEPSGSEASKFRLWVKTKGFHLGPPVGHPDENRPDANELLYIPTGTDKSTDGKVHFVYKKVAMVEQFFDIIYSVHVESALDTQLRGRAGKHCGQKRTYRAVADQYAFIPREAISKFLLYCVDCQRKNSMDSKRGTSSIKKPSKPNVESNEEKSLESTTLEDEDDVPSPSSSSTETHLTPSAAAALSQAVAAMQTLAANRSPLMQLTTPSLLASRAAAALMSRGRSPLAMAALINNNNNNLSEKMETDDDNNTSTTNDTTSNSEIDLSLPITSTYLRRMRALGLASGSLDQNNFDKEGSSPVESDRVENDEVKKDESTTNGWNNAYIGNGSGTLQKNGQSMSQLSTLFSQNGSNISVTSTIPEQQQQQSVNENVSQDDASSNGAKDDDDDEDDDDISDDRIEGIGCGDPEKLKAFNMFVRLFVDENLDRHVPISKQPKEKIQAIIDSCTRQFPEHACRARKRIRTYLKSCRRTKRTREQAGLDPTNARPTPPHLTSVQAEQLLARACENEAENAKRMRMGMEPISQPMPVYSSNNEVPIDVVSTVSVTTNTTNSCSVKPEQLATLLAATQQPNIEAKTAFPGMNGTTMYRQPFQQQTTTFPSNPTPLPLQTVQNGPGTEGMKKAPLLNHKLNTTEMAAVRQLITGYRESAAFLLRSADELEQLLQIQPKL